MCTLTLRLERDSLLVTMNRDELRSRAPELPPGLQDGWGGPRDGEKLGTWFGVSPAGTVACLLNAYRADEPLRPVPGAPSRGEIVPALLRAGGSFPEPLDLSPYPSFTLLVASPGRAEVFRWWQGVGMTTERLHTGWHTLNSSAWPGAQAWREELFGAWVEAGCDFAGELPSYHLVQVPGREHISPLMTRPEAGTRSITQARVTPRGSLLQYWSWPSRSVRAPDCRLRVE